MQCTCDNVLRMPHIQIRNVPPELHRKLKVRAAEAGMTLSDYLLREIKRIGAVPTMEELAERVRSQKRYRFKESAGEIIRRERRYE